MQSWNSNKRSNSCRQKNLLAFGSGSRNSTPRYGTGSLKKAPSLENSTNWQTKPSRIFVRASTKNYDALHLALVLGTVRQVARADSGVGRQELQTTQDESASSLVATQKSGQVLVSESRPQVSRSGGRDSRGTTLVLDWDTRRIRPRVRMSPQHARTQNIRTLTTPRTRLSGEGGWHSWKAASFRAARRAWSAGGSVCRHAFPQRMWRLRQRMNIDSRRKFPEMHSSGEQGRICQTHHQSNHIS